MSLVDGAALWEGAPSAEAAALRALERRDPAERWSPRMRWLWARLTPWERRVVYVLAHGYTIDHADERAATNFRHKLAAMRRRLRRLEAAAARDGDGNDAAYVRASAARVRRARLREGRS